MNWNAVRRHNAVASARRAKRERNKQELDRRIEQAGGPFKAAEIRQAPVRWAEPAPGHFHRRLVLSIRGRDWVPGYSDGEQWQSLAPFRDWRQDPDYRECIPVTPGARAVLLRVITTAFEGHPAQEGA